MAQNRIGLWLIGAKGGVATTSIVGLSSLAMGVTEPAGLVSCLPQFSSLELTDWSDFVVGGHEIRDVTLVDEAARLADNQGAIDRGLLEKCRSALGEIDARVRPGTIVNVGTTIAELAGPNVPEDETPSNAIQRIRQDMADFVAAEDLAHLIVVYVASTEPTIDAAKLPPTWKEMEQLIEQPTECPLPASSLYAIATLGAGWSFVNFTPSLGAVPTAIDELARINHTQHAGCDGKTGETLMKSTLAPMFAHRNLPVMSWVGHNIFGNLDGKVLDDPTNKQAKVTSKDRLLSKVLGYAPQTLVSIEYIESLGDWKTAWDHIHFRGFLGTPMTLQFTWQGCDSLLAAPLLLDLVRFTELARRRGETGQLKFLASFFKSPLGVDEHNFERQFQMLEDWAREDCG